jgi:hypothetical protein
MNLTKESALIDRKQANGYIADNSAYYYLFFPCNRGTSAEWQGG